MKNLSKLLVVLPLVMANVTVVSAEGLTDEPSVKSELISLLKQNKLELSQGGVSAVNESTGEDLPVLVLKSTYDRTTLDGKSEDYYAIANLGSNGNYNSLKEKLSDLSNIKPSAYIEGEDDDGTYVYAKLRLDYDKIKSSPAKYLLQKVSGSWTVRTSQITLANRRVGYCGYNILTQKSNAKFYYPSSNSFSYSTGYKKYIDDINGSIVAAQMSVKVKRGTGSWNFKFSKELVEKIPGGAGDIFK